MEFFVSPEQIANARAKEIQQQQEHVNMIQSLNHSEIYEYLQDSLDSTEIVLEGLNCSGIKTEVSGINYVTISRLRGSIVSALLWLEKQHPELAPKVDESVQAEIQEIQETVQNKPSKKQKTSKEQEDEEL